MKGFETYCYKDGADFVVIFKNCSPDLEKMIQNFLTPTQVQDSTLEAGETEDVLISFASYAGRYAKDILAEEGMKGYGNLKWMKDNGKVETGQISALNEILSIYAYEKISGIQDPYGYFSTADMDTVRLFIRVFDDYITEDMKAAVTEQAGYKDYPTFIANAGEEQIRSFAAAFVEKYKG